MAPLAESGEVIVFDHPAFGLTERSLPGNWGGENPYSPESRASLTMALMDRLGVGKAVLVGHSAGGTIAVLTALRYPERIKALVLVTLAVYASGSPLDRLHPLLHTPQMRRLGPLPVRSISTWGEAIIRTAWYDPSEITPGVLTGYKEPYRNAGAGDHR